MTTAHAKITGAQIAALCAEVHGDNVKMGWWTDLATGESLVGRRNVGELLMLCVSELCEGAEGLADNLMDDKIPERQMIEVELADFAIRVFDLGGGLDIAERIAIEFDLSRNAADLQSIFCPIDTPNDFLLRTIRFVSAAMEHHRKGRITQMAHPLAYALHGVFILGEILDLDVMGAVAQKRAFNRVREDHQVDNRRAAGGKRY